MNRMSIRLDRLERGGSNAWRAWQGVPHSLWPEQALIALLAETEGWPPGHVPTEAELRAIVAEGRGGTA